MDKATGAYLDEKTGHEMQLLTSGRVIDLDAELKRLGIAHDATDLESPERWGLRGHWASVGKHADDDLTKHHVAAHVKRHHGQRAEHAKHVARLASEHEVVAGRKTMHIHLGEHFPEQHPEHVPAAQEWLKKQPA